jgi:hypothetical protein
MKLGGSLGNVPQKLKKLLIETRYNSLGLLVHFQECNIIYSTLENGLTVRNMSNFE